MPGAPAGAAVTAGKCPRRVVAASPRIAIDTPRLNGSIDLKGARIDNLSLEQYRETIDPKSPAIVLLSPSGSPDAYYAEFGWVPAAGTTEKMPGPDTIWTQDGSGALGINHPITLSYDNGAGLLFRRIIAVDDRYLFTIKDEVQNHGANPVTLYPYALISRHGTPKTLGYYILHEGLIGVMGDQGLQTVTYKKIEESKEQHWDVTNAWLGFTDKYWAAALLPDTDAKVHARFPRARPAIKRPIRPITCSSRKPLHRARPARSTRGCSPAPRKFRWSASTSRSRPPAATTKRSGSTISTC